MEDIDITILERLRDTVRTLQDTVDTLTTTLEQSRIGTQHEVRIAYNTGYFAGLKEAAKMAGEKLR